MTELIFLMIFKLVLVFPGAFIRWAFTGFRKPYKYYLEESELNAGLGVVLLIIIVLIIKYSY